MRRVNGRSTPPPAPLPGCDAMRCRQDADGSQSRAESVAGRITIAPHPRHNPAPPHDCRPHAGCPAIAPHHQFTRAHADRARGGRAGVCVPVAATLRPKGRMKPAFREDQTRSNRSAFITLFHAAAKSFTNVSRASALPYTSAKARSWECDPKIRSTRVPVHFFSCVLRSTPS